MHVWYKIDLRRSSWRSLWADSPGVLVFLLKAVYLKLLRYNPPPVVGIALNQGHRPIECDCIPSAAQQALRTMIDECGKHSFQLACYFSTDILGDAEGYLASMLHAGGRIRGAAHWIRGGNKIVCGFTFTSRLENGDIYSTTNLARNVDLPPGMYGYSYPGASIEELFSRHRQLLERLGQPAAVTLTPEQLPEELNEQIRRTHAYLLARGEIKPMTPAEIERLTFVMAELVPEPSDNPFRSPLFEEVETPPRRPQSAWRAMLNGAFSGFILGAIVGLVFASEPKPALNATLWEKGAAILRLLGWQPLPALAGAFLGWLSWRRAKRREPSTSSN